VKPRPPQADEVIRGGGIDQFADQHRRLAHAAIARIGAEIAEVEHLLRGGEQLQEQEAVVLAGGAVARTAARRPARR
jgi:molybdopterin biosynthesis enzyme